MKRGMRLGGMWTGGEALSIMWTGRSDYKALSKTSEITVFLCHYFVSSVL